MTTATSNQRRQPLEQSPLIRGVIRDIDAGAVVTESSNLGGSWAGQYYLGTFTGTGTGQQTVPEATDRIHYLTKDETRQMDPPFPPEPGYDD